MSRVLSLDDIKKVLQYDPFKYLDAALVDDARRQMYQKRLAEFYQHEAEFIQRQAGLLHNNRTESSSFIKYGKRAKRRLRGGNRNHEQHKF